MIVFVVGTVGSASTWMFNASRMIMSFVYKDAVSLYSEAANELLVSLPAGTKNVTVKAHSLDSATLALMRLAECRLIVTLRDPRDSVASNIERFGQTFEELVSSVSRTYATLASLPADCSILVFHYRDDPTARPETLRKLADYIESDIPDSELEAFFVSHQFETLRERIAKRAGGHETEITLQMRRDDFDRNSHWHHGHLGDGQNGKWVRHMSEAQGAAIEACLPLDPLGVAWQSKPLRWSSVLFKFNDGHVPSGPGPEIVTLNKLDGAVYGPYLYLPRGRWLVEADITLRNGDNTAFTLDVFSNQRGLIALQTFRISSASKRPVSLRFNNEDHAHVLEVRIHSANPNVVGTTINFGGARLTWLNSIE